MRHKFNLAAVFGNQIDQQDDVSFELGGIRYGVGIRDS